MKKAFSIFVLFLVASVGLAACTPPPPLKSDKYLRDTSLITGQPCAAPCFQGITVGKTTFSDAETLLKGNPLFSNVQKQESSGRPPLATFNTKEGEAVGQLTADEKGLVDALLVKLAPGVTTADLIKAMGEDPTYVTGIDYSQTEVALALIFPKKGLVAWVAPGDSTATLKESDPVVVVLYIAPDGFPKLLDTAELRGWAGYISYATYKANTPVITPKVTATPQ
jgi:hypothetical protein